MTCKEFFYNDDKEGEEKVGPKLAEEETRRLTESQHRERGASSLLA